MIFSWFDLCALPLIGRGLMLAWDAVAQAHRFEVCQAARGRPGAYAPRVSILAPCKGLDEGLQRSLEVLATLDYPRYELIFIVEAASDAAFAKLTEFCSAHQRFARVIVAGLATDSGQKVHNLLCGLDAVSPQTDVFAFLDSDVILQCDWLRELIAPLESEMVGATTGFRWYSLENAGLASVVRSAWTQATAVTLGGKRNAFAWGGSMAIRRCDFEAWGVARRWRGAISDDFILSEAVCQAKREIRFVPTCMLISPDRVGWRELLEFTTRQMTIARVYYPTIWKVAVGWYVFYALAFWTLFMESGAQAVTGQAAAAQAAILLIWGLGAFVQGMTLKAMRVVLGKSPIGNCFQQLAFCAVGPLTATLYAWNAIASACSNRIAWRGVSYELVSKRRVIIHRLGADSTNVN